MNLKLGHETADSVTEKREDFRAVRTVSWLVSTRLTSTRNIPRENTARQRGDDTRYALLRARSVTQPARNAILLHIRCAAAAAAAAVALSTDLFRREKGATFLEDSRCKKVLDPELAFDHGKIRQLDAIPDDFFILYYNRCRKHSYVSLFSNERISSFSVS